MAPRMNTPMPSLLYDRSAQSTMPLYGMPDGDWEWPALELLPWYTKPRCSPWLFDSSPVVATGIRTAGEVVGRRPPRGISMSIR